ncbi:hypothetical protein Lche_1345 [Legionella cherrii]|uniref:Uncharacterized protein n=1 Tax=Legionella cherrii TaxID=28084 RepID=A0A0W0S8G6_9GAMM|nr:hypothetical protein Lche_1345 [Legionella cherrii]
MRKTLGLYLFFFKKMENLLIKMNELYFCSIRFCFYYLVVLLFCVRYEELSLITGHPSPIFLRKEAGILDMDLRIFFSVYNIVIL